MESPLDAVLTTPELLENILGCLQLREIFCSRRVSAFWQDTIINSIKLRRAMYIAPDTAPLKPRGYCLRYRSVPVYDETLSIHPRVAWFTNLKKPSTMQSMQCYIPSDKARVKIRLRKELEKSLLPEAYEATDADLVLQEVPWLAQYVTQPPCTTLHFNSALVLLGSHWPKEVAASIYNTSGIRLLDVWRAISKIRENVVDYVGEGNGAMKRAAVTFFDDNRGRSWPICGDGCGPPILSHPEAHTCSSECFYESGDEFSDADSSVDKESCGEEASEDDEALEGEEGHSDDGYCESRLIEEESEECEDDWEAEIDPAFVQASMEGLAKWVGEGYAIGIGRRRRQAAGLD